MEWMFLCFELQTLHLTLGPWKWTHSMWYRKRCLHSVQYVHAPQLKCLKPLCMNRLSTNALFLIRVSSSSISLSGLIFEPEVKELSVSSELLELDSGRDLYWFSYGVGGSVSSVMSINTIPSPVWPAVLTLESFLWADLSVSHLLPGNRP